MYLARGILNTASRAVQRDLSDPVELHRTVMKLFPDQLGDNPRRALGVLHRVDEDRRRSQVVLFVQSAVLPDFARLPSEYFAAAEGDLDLALAGEQDNPRVRSVAGEREAIVAGDRFVFRLRANTTRKILTKSLPDGTKQNGKRVPLLGDDAKVKWLERRGERDGFRIDPTAVRVANLETSRGRGKHSVTFDGALFEGVLAVADATAFRLALAHGIGPAKAYGFGLLSIQRARP